MVTHPRCGPEILERQRTEETLRASEERYRNLFDNATDMVYTHDLQGRFTSINRAAERITGYTREEAMKMTIADVVAPEHLELARQMIVRKLGGAGSTVYELAILTKDGRRLLVEVSSHLMFEEGKPTGVLGIAREITERKRLEEQLRQSQKIEAIGRLAGGIAHDFNNLLTIIGAYSHMLLMDLPPDQPARAYAQEILAAAERASALTDRLLAFSRRQVVQPTVVDLNEVIRNMAGLLRRMVGEDIELETVLAPDLGKVRADPTQLEQVIMNLVINSRDAMPSGGKVTLETENLLVERAERGGPAPGSWTVLRVHDTGHGMDAETKSHLFEPFFTTKGPGKGTGLGLSIVYGIVKQSGGEIAVESEVGKGTVFTIYLPHANGAA
ncbi:MAG: two-component system sensor histidine kinase NtrB, partial [Bryobacteraceae bacterium]